MKNADLVCYNPLIIGPAGLEDSPVYRDVL